MDTERILAELRQQRDQIDAAIAALGGSRSGNGRRRGRPAGSPLALRAGRRRVRRLSAAARKKISEAAKARWAQAKKQGRNSL